jgi:hypothetical protein
MQFTEFKKLDIKDREYFNQQLMLSQTVSCEQSFANLYCWQDSCNTHWFEYNSQLFIWYAAEMLLLMPAGKFISPKKLVEILDGIVGAGSNGAIYDVPSAYIEQYPELTELFIISDTDDEFDYIYKVDKLINFSGKKLRKKRNLLKQFFELYPNTRIEPLSSDHSSDCLKLNSEINYSKPDLAAETLAIKRFFTAFDALKGSGCAIYIEDKLIGFSVVSLLNKTVACEHFEKIDHQYKGAAQVLVNETAKLLPKTVLYLNREQDMGIQGLRQAKRSYDPELILKRYQLRLKQTTVN